MSRGSADIKGAAEIELMRRSGRIVWEILQEMAGMARPGVSTFEIDRVAERLIHEKGAKPAFKGYKGFPACVCISINEEVVHGIPSKKRLLRDGDLLSLDFGVVCEGWYGDSAVTVPVGRVDAQSQKLIDVTRAAMHAGIAAIKPGARLHDIGHAVQALVEKNGFSIVRDFVGHGIGRHLHEDPQVPNYGDAGTGPRLRPGMVLAIEPMVNAGSPDVLLLEDGWTAVTADGQRSAHFEHTVAVTETGASILTLPEGVAAGLEGQQAAEVASADAACYMPRLPNAVVAKG
ncbi:MAG TPA: type I methionyl aminopeptidase [Myxococcales bacterium]|nr:type I methionyl aminopeptidase [Myxococcales bacterium]